MPYITQGAKDALADGAQPHDAGELTYLLQQVVQDYIRSATHGYRYQTYAEVLGALEGCKADFVDRILLPHERNKKLDNGDVWQAPR